MEPTFGERLAAARKRAGFATQQSLGDLIGVAGRTVRNWETGKTSPDVAMLSRLREELGAFDSAGDPVEVAVRESRLTEDRQYVVLGVYKRELREQDEADERRRGA